jgi:hypothetical protein
LTSRVTERISLALTLLSAGASIFWSTARISTFWSSVVVLPPPVMPIRRARISVGMSAAT